MRFTLNVTEDSVLESDVTDEEALISETSEEVSDSILPDWWLSINDWLDDKCGNFYSCYWYYLCIIYGIVSLAALIQLIRIQQRAPEYGWTTQKLFHFMNFIVFLLRSVSFGFYDWYEVVTFKLETPVINLIVFDLPGLLFFTTYTLLVLFWAEIYHQASGAETESLKPAFININIFVYIVQIIIWVSSIFYTTVVRYVSATWIAAVSFGAVVGFLVYGCRLFSMLRDFPIESRGRKRKLNEVGCITFICTLCFTIRFVLTILIYVNEDDFDLDLLDDDLLNIIFYIIVEVLPAISVLAILHRLPPPKRISSLNPKAPPRVMETADDPEQIDTDAPPIPKF